MKILKKWISKGNFHLDQMNGFGILKNKKDKWTYEGQLYIFLILYMLKILSNSKFTYWILFTIVKQN